MNIDFQTNINLASFTTFGIGGRAKFFVIVKTLTELDQALKFAKQNKLAIFILGGGSNILVSDQGFDGLVIKIELSGIRFRDNLIEVQAGESWDKVVQATIDHGLAGIECLSGIPGTMGGAVVQNIGAYGQTISDRLFEVEVLEIETMKVQKFSRSDCAFDYRNSIFKQNPSKYIVLSATLSLDQNGNPSLSYPALGKYFENQTPNVSQVRQAVIEIRASKGMVILPEYESYKSAGSFFKNPSISPIQFEAIKSQISCLDPWYWEEQEKWKISAACLITQSGNNKCDTYGAAQISPRQPLALINPGFATAVDVATFAVKIQNDVRNRFGIELEREVLYVGQF